MHEQSIGGYTCLPWCDDQELDAQMLRSFDGEEYREVVVGVSTVMTALDAYRGPEAGNFYKDDVLHVGISLPGSPNSIWSCHRFLGRT